MILVNRGQEGGRDRRRARRSHRRRSDGVVDGLHGPKAGGASQGGLDGVAGRAELNQLSGADGGGAANGLDGLDLEGREIRHGVGRDGVGVIGEENAEAVHTGVAGGGQGVALVAGKSVGQHNSADTGRERLGVGDTG